MPKQQLSKAPTARNSRQRGLNSRNILRNDFQRKGFHNTMFKPNNIRDSMRLKTKNLQKFSTNGKQMEIDSVIKGSTTNKITNEKETRFIIPNIQNNKEIQNSLLRVQQDCKEELNHEISMKIPKSPPSCVRGDFASIEFLEN